jgi:hypothetical protein
MTDKTFAELQRGANEALAHAQGKRKLYMATRPFPRESVNRGVATRPRPTRRVRKRPVR